MFYFLKKNKNNYIEEEEKYEVVGGEKSMDINISVMKDNSKRLALLHSIGGISQATRAGFYVYATGRGDEDGIKIRQKDTILIEGGSNIQLTFIDENTVLGLYIDSEFSSEERHHEYLQENFKDIYDMYEEYIFPFYPYNGQSKEYTGLFWIKDNKFNYIADNKEQIKEIISYELKYIIKKYDMEKYYSAEGEIKFSTEEKYLLEQLWGKYKEDKRQEIDVREIIENYKQPLDEFDSKELIIRNFELDLDDLGFNVLNYDDQEVRKYIITELTKN